MSSLATSSPVSASTRPVFNAVASVSVDLIEADLFGIGGGRVQRDRTGDEGQTKETFPIGSRDHTQNSVSGAARIQDDRERLVPTSRLVPCGYLTCLTGVALVAGNDIALTNPSVCPEQFQLSRRWYCRT